jgi:hypothetical protein
VLGADVIDQPFPQLARPVQQLPAGRENDTEITWFAELGIPSAFLWRLLTKQNYRRSGHEDGLASWAYVKVFPGAGLTAVLELEGTGSLNPRSGRDEFLRVCRAYFLPGLAGRGQWLGSPGPLAQVNPVVLSEVLNDLHNLASKGQAIPPRPPAPSRVAPVASPLAGTRRPVLVGNGTAGGWEDEIPF